jgi:hypothetical protein
MPYGVVCDAALAATAPWAVGAYRLKHPTRCCHTFFSAANGHAVRHDQVYVSPALAPCNVLQAWPGGVRRETRGCLTTTPWCVRPAAAPPQGNGGPGRPQGPAGLPQVHGPGAEKQQLGAAAAAGQLCCA